jgi:hypothetical protein
MINPCCLLTTRAVTLFAITMKNISLTLLCGGLIAATMLWSDLAHTQPAPQRPPGGGPRGGNAQTATDPFTGVTTDGKVRRGLFKIQATGISTEPVRKAAEAYLASLSEDQRKKTLFPVDDPEWRMWYNVHRAARQGISFKEMTAAQRELAFDLFRASLSAKGFKTTRDIMRLNGTLAELTNNSNEYGEWLYFVTIMGKPSATEPWGWQLDGHHGIINYFVLGDQVVMTPTFMGGEPIRAESGEHKGTVILQAEQDKGLALMRALDVSQQGKARIKAEKGNAESLAQAFRDNLVLDYAGLRATEMNAGQKRMLLDIVAEYIGNMKEGHARVKMSEVEQHLDSTWFAWIGGTGADSVFYYRVHSPVILIEFDHQGPIGLRGQVPNGPNRNHIHSVVRTPNGNDYGKDLLRQHHEQHPHGPADAPKQ